MFGKIHVYYEAKGYGFVSVNFRERHFFHIKNYVGEVIPTPGMLVEFDLVPSRPGKPDEAVHIIPVTTNVGGAQ